MISVSLAPCRARWWRNRPRGWDCLSRRWSSSTFPLPSLTSLSSSRAHSWVLVESPSRLLYLKLKWLSFCPVGTSFPFTLALAPDCIVGDGFLSPEVLTASPSATTQLESLFIRLDHKSYPEQESANTPPRASLLVLRALIEFRFVGSGEHPEDFISGWTRLFSRGFPSLCHAVSLVSLNYPSPYPGLNG